MSNGQAAPEPALEEQIQLLKAQLAQAQKMTAIGELASSTAHEFNNVLMTIINYAKLGLRHQDQATREKAFDKILAAGNRATKITNSILGMARNRSGKQEPTDLRPIIEDTITLMERECRKYRVSIETDLQPAPQAMADGNQIQQVLLNLLINARQALPDGGRIAVRLGHDAESRMIELGVRDTGSGIPQDKLRRIFDPFFTTKSGPDASGKGGTGLGLAMCREIIEAHRGRIRVESTVGTGTAFTLRIPAAETTPSEASTLKPARRGTAPGISLGNFAPQSANHTPPQHR